jgi:hypothetical protein
MAKKKLEASDGGVIEFRKGGEELTPSEVLASALDAWIKAYYRDITKARALRAATDLRASL